LKNTKATRDIAKGLKTPAGGARWQQPSFSRKPLRIGQGGKCESRNSGVGGNTPDDLKGMLAAQAFSPRVGDALRTPLSWRVQFGIPTICGCSGHEA
jgi:hypothetical protein